MNEQEIDEWLTRNDRFKTHTLSVCSALDGLIGSQLSSRFTFGKDDSKNFHKIFFETSFITFDLRIRMYEEFLTIYESDWFSKTEIKQIFGLLKKFKGIRNDFAHAMDPTPFELKNRPKSEMPYCLIYKYVESEMIPIPLTEGQVNAITKDIENLKMLLLTVDAKILNHKDALREKIKSGEA